MTTNYQQPEPGMRIITAKASTLSAVPTAANFPPFYTIAEFETLMDDPIGNGLVEVGQFNELMILPLIDGSAFDQVTFYVAQIYPVYSDNEIVGYEQKFYGSTLCIAGSVAVGSVSGVPSAIDSGDLVCVATVTAGANENPGAVFYAPLTMGSASAGGWIDLHTDNAPYMRFVVGRASGTHTALLLASLY